MWCCIPWRYHEGPVGRPDTRFLCGWLSEDAVDGLCLTCRRGLRTMGRLFGRVKHGITVCRWLAARAWATFVDTPIIIAKEKYPACVCGGAPACSSWLCHAHGEIVDKVGGKLNIPQEELVKLGEELYNTDGANTCLKCHDDQVGAADLRHREPGASIRPWVVMRHLTRTKSSSSTISIR